MFLLLRFWAGGWPPGRWDVHSWHTRRINKITLIIRITCAHPRKSHYSTGSMHVIATTRVDGGEQRKAARGFGCGEPRGERGVVRRARWFGGGGGAEPGFSRIVCEGMIHGDECFLRRLLIMMGVCMMYFEDG